jgi:hypothetical protein
MNSTTTQSCQYLPALALMVCVRLVVLFLYMIRWPHSLQRIGSLGLISFFAPQSTLLISMCFQVEDRNAITGTDVLHPWKTFAFHDVSRDAQQAKRLCCRVFDSEGDYKAGPRIGAQSRKGRHIRCAAAAEQLHVRRWIAISTIW